MMPLAERRAAVELARELVHGAHAHPEAERAVADLARPALRAAVAVEVRSR